MTFKKYLKQSETNESVKIIKTKEFSDSGEATDTIYTILEMMDSPAMKNWAKATDKNYPTNCVIDLKQAITAYKKFVQEIESAD